MHRTLALLMLVALAAPARALPIRTLVIEGRVVDRDGFPIPHARVVTADRPRLTLPLDESGHYSVPLMLGSVQGLERTAFTIRIGARAAGWRIGIGDGGEPLALVIHATPGPRGSARIEVRSNDPDAARAVADSIVHGTRDPLRLVINLTGIRGAAGSMAMPRLEQLASATLRDLEWPLAPPAALAAAPSSAPRAQVQVIDTSARRNDSGGSSAMATSTPESVSAGPPAGGAGHDAASGTASGTSTATGRFRLFPSAEDVLESGSRRQAQRSVPPPRDTTRAASDTDRSSAPVRDTVVMVAPVHRVTATATHPGPRVNPDERFSDRPHVGEGRAASPPSPAPAERSILVNRSPTQGRAAPATPVRATPPTPGCGCIVRGAIELGGDRPVRGTVTVVIGVADFAAPADTVTLEPGIPVSFELRMVPCGTRRLVVMPLGRQRLRIGSPEALRPFECNAGTQLRPDIVILPR